VGKGINRERGDIKK
jgi:hypothetical protein